MPNGKPPVVWHLDTDGIDDFSYNPIDRLTMVKRVMQCAELENSPIDLKKALKAIDRICKNKMTPEELEQWLIDNGCPDSENQEGA